MKPKGYRLIHHIKEKQPLNTMAKKNKTYYDLQHTTQKTNDPRTPLKTGSEIRFSGRVDCFYFTSDTRRITVIINPLTSPGRRKDVIMVTSNGRNTTVAFGDLYDICILFSGIHTMQLVIKYDSVS